MLRYAMCLSPLILMLAGTGCDSGPRSSAGFRLAASGDIARGKAAYVEHECGRCHQVRGVDLPEVTPRAATRIVLGGEVPRHVTDGYLVTAIINPGHVVSGQWRRIAGSVEGTPMPRYDSISVQEMTDLVAFLQSTYKISRVVPDAQF